MITNLKPYPAYKDSGVKSLGKIPKHWEVRRFKFLLREVDRRSETGSEQLLRVSQYTGVTERKRTDGSHDPDTRAASLVDYKLVEPDNLVVNIMLAWNGSLGVSPYDGIVSPAYCVYRFSSGVHPQFYHHLLRSPVYKARIKAASTGVVESRLRLYTDNLYRLEGLRPPLPEQTAIVRFLDWVDRRIRQVIRAREKRIKLLEEYKQALIHQAVTGQINVRTGKPYPKYKDSGVEWLGKVPEHWEVLALKRVLRCIVDCEHNTAPAVDESPYRVIRTTAVRNGILRLDGTYCTTQQAYLEWTQRAVPQPGDVVFTREAPAGEACVIPEGNAFCLGQRTVLMKVNPDWYDAQFLVHMIYVGPPRFHIQLASQGSTVGHFNMDDIGWMLVLRPPLDEQQAIVEFLDKQTERIGTAIVATRRAVDLLNEFRTRLTADVVTGKLDVRGYNVVEEIDRTPQGG